MPSLGAILASFAAALAQLTDPRFRGVLWRGIGLTVALLAGFYAVLVGGLNWLLPDTVTLPWVGEVGWIDDLATGASVLALLVASIFLMVPVASACTGLFLDDVADAVEARHYRHLSPARRLGLAEGLRDALMFLGLLILGNILAFAASFAVPPAGPVLFLGLNGYLLGREYFQMIAARRLGRDGAARAWRAGAPTIWLAGVLMTVPLTVPLLNLLVPVVAAASFTHLFHRLSGTHPVRR